MSQSKTIGEVLKGLGRITESDIETALAHQAEHGGYFGEALVACGLLTQEELEFGLASQFDLPYVFPDAEAVDLEAASLVSPEWALEHLTLPIVKTAETLTVVVDSPLREASLEHLRERTGLELELGLASAPSIRELVRQVFARAAALDEDDKEPLSLENTIDAVLDAEAARWGISVRGARAHAWWDDHGTIRRRQLAGDWRGSLDRILVPPPGEVVTGSRAAWDAEIARAGRPTSVAARCLADESGREYLFRPRPRDVPPAERFAPPPDGIISEIRILARSGEARFVVTTDPPDLGHALLPHLPELTLDPSWRSIYVSVEDRAAAEETFSVQLPADHEAWDAELEGLKGFHFDAVTVDLAGHVEEWAASALDVASVAFLLCEEEDVPLARAAGVHWRLGVSGQGEDLTWTLESLDE